MKHIDIRRGAPSCYTEAVCPLLEHHLLSVLQERDPNSEMSLSVKIQLNQFVSEVSETYGNAKFHNWAHANHVTTAMNKLLTVLQEGGEELVPLNSFSLVFAALVHDAGHTGLSNKILKDMLSNKFDKFIDDKDTHKAKWQGYDNRYNHEEMAKGELIEFSNEIK